MIVNVTLAGFTDAMLLQATFGTVAWYPRRAFRQKWITSKCGAWCGRGEA